MAPANSTLRPVAIGEFVFWQWAKHPQVVDRTAPFRPPQGVSSKGKAKFKGQVDYKDEDMHPWRTLEPVEVAAGKFARVEAP